MPLDFQAPLSIFFRFSNIDARRWLAQEVKSPAAPMKEVGRE